MKINLKALLRTITGKNKAGQIIYGALDIAPIPPIHNLIRLAVKEQISVKKMPSFVWQKLDKLRLSTSILAIALAFAVIKGWITADEAKQLLEFITNLM